MVLRYVGQRSSYGRVTSSRLTWEECTNQRERLSLSTINIYKHTNITIGHTLFSASAAVVGKRMPSTPLFLSGSRIFLSALYCYDWKAWSFLISAVRFRGRWRLGLGGLFSFHPPPCPLVMKSDSYYVIWGSNVVVAKQNSNQKLSKQRHTMAHSPCRLIFN